MQVYTHTSLPAIEWKVQHFLMHKSNLTFRNTVKSSILLLALAREKLLIHWKKLHKDNGLDCCNTVWGRALIQSDSATDLFLPSVVEMERNLILGTLPL